MRSHRVSKLLFIGIILVICLLALYTFQKPHQETGGKIREGPPSGLKAASSNPPQQKISLSTELDDYKRAVEGSHQLQVWGILTDSPQGPKILGLAAKELGISENQRIMINHALMEASIEIRNLQSKHVQVLGQTDTELQLRIPPFPEEGQSVRSTLAESIRSTIGNERGDIILKLLNKELKEKFRDFGNEAVLITGRAKENGMNEIQEGNIIHGFSGEVSFDSMVKHLFKFEDIK